MRLTQPELDYTHLWGCHGSKAPRSRICLFLISSSFPPYNPCTGIMSVTCFAPRLLMPQWRLHSTRLVSFPSKRNFCFITRVISSADNDDSSSRQSQHLGYDPSEELLGLEVDLPSRNAISGAPRPRSWFGPNGQYIRELPCPSCRGRGYTPCTECGIERSRMNCSQCSGKGIVTCHRCLGECVIWEESIDEQPWEKARSISPFKVKEDDEVDNLDIKLDMKKKSKRVYRSSPEVGLKISRALKSLNAKTGLFTKRMKIIHSNPTLHAQRVAAIKKSRGAPAARKRASEVQKAFFSNPENRHRRSIAMKGIKFYCSHCGRKGHRRHYCPELKDSLIDRRFRCRVCGEKGHNRRTCMKLVPRYHSEGTVARFHRCKMCGQHGHNRRTCPKKKGNNSAGKEEKTKKKASRKIYTCRLCKQKGHNNRTCPTRNEAVADTSPPS